MAPLHRAAAENAEIWKAAFLGSDEIPGQQASPLERCWQEALAELDHAEVETVGGYKTMLTSRLIETPRSDENGLEQRQQGLDSGKTTDFKKINVDRVVILFRLHGRPVLWGTYPQDALATFDEMDIQKITIGVSLQQLDPGADLVKVLRPNAQVRKKGNEGNQNAIERVKGLSLEVYASVDPVQGREAAQEVQTWCGLYAPRNIWTEVSPDATVRLFESGGFITPQHHLSTAVAEAAFTRVSASRLSAPRNGRSSGGTRGGV